MGSAWSSYIDPEGTPHPLKNSSFDPLYGFSNGRKERGKIKDILVKVMYFW